ncbi:hypothetical protein LX64_02202 [Chitinophaga skermanii]|uniref:Uncharacterized protein n=2 Tax=Chitinophaga skermanii TaxID=331697 RepID=A0A327QM00_9BACT|nr:hypothetical protein LX64_02202 [Chitinophaga skermanii]
MHTTIFKEIWQRDIMPLQGTTIKTQTRQLTNEIVAVTGTHLTRISSNHRESSIPYEKFEIVFNELLKNGTITRKQIDTLNKSIHPKIRAASIMMAVFVKVKGTHYIHETGELVWLDSF